MKKLLSKLYHIVVFLMRLNITKTLYFNFKVLPFKQAVKLPFFLYGKIYLLQLNGVFKMPYAIHTGMIKIGYRWLDLWPMSFLPTQIQNCGHMQFNGPCIISGGANINVQSKDGVLTVGEQVIIGGGTIIKCLDNIVIGNSSRIAGNCHVMDCNMHFVKNIDNGTVANYKAPIIIGESCWINYGSIVSKGAVIPDYSITSRNSFVSKDFSESGTNLFLVGAPAKPISSHVQRIFSAETQMKFAEYFKKNRVSKLQLNPGIEPEVGVKEGF